MTFQKPFILSKAKNRWISGKIYSVMIALFAHYFIYVFLSPPSQMFALEEKLLHRTQHVFSVIQWVEIWLASNTTDQFADTLPTSSCRHSSEGRSKIGVTKSKDELKQQIGRWCRLIDALIITVCHLIGSLQWSADFRIVFLFYFLLKISSILLFVFQGSIVLFALKCVICPVWFQYMPLLYIFYQFY